MTFKCADCGHVFNDPAAVENGFSHDFGTEISYEDACPACGSVALDELEACECCGEQLRLRGSHLCKSCRHDLLEKVIAFFDTLTAKEEAQFDDWMDGDSITERRNWTDD